MQQRQNFMPNMRLALKLRNNWMEKSTEMVLITCKIDCLGYQNEGKLEIMRVSLLTLEPLIVWNPKDGTYLDWGYDFQGY